MIRREPTSLAYQVETESDISQNSLCSSVGHSWVAAYACRRGRVSGIAGIGSCQASLAARDMFMNERSSIKNLCPSTLEYTIPVELAAHAGKGVNAMLVQRAVLYEVMLHH